MKFQKNLFLINGSLERTLQVEGGSTIVFAQNALAQVGFDSEGIHFFEVGPKHGVHTLVIDSYNPASITCVEAPNKFRSAELFTTQNGKWISKIRTESFEIHYQDFSNFVSARKYDLLFYCGVMYHNVDQMNQLKKLHDLAADGAMLVFESSTVRTQSLQDMNVIEVHHPPYSEFFRGIETCSFHPSKKACKSMLEIAGWTIVDETDNHPELANPERIALLCSRGQQKRNRHLVER